MNGKQIERECWRMAAQNASPIRLTIILYDLLASDLRRAIDAIRSKDIERRCKELDHAYLVLMQLEGTLETEQGGETALHLCRFYSHLRAKVLEAQIKQSAEILEQQINLIQEVRRAWEQVELREGARQSALLAAPAIAPPDMRGKEAASWIA
jgi:flagellar protein FliS